MSSSRTFVARLFERLRPFVAIIYQKYWLFILLGLLLTALALYPIIGGFIVDGGPKLKVNTNLGSLIPESYKSVQALNKIKDKVSGIDKLEILIQSDDFDASLRFAEKLIPRLQELPNPEKNEPYIGNIEYQNEVEFYEKNQLLFVDVDDLNNLKTTIEERIAKEKNKLNPLLVDDLFGDDESNSADEGTDSSLAKLEEKYEQHVPKKYLATNDGRILMIRCYPYGSALNLEAARRFYYSVESLVQDADPKSYHASMFFELGGEVRNKVEEYDVITSDAKTNLSGGLLLQILLIILYFRQPIRLSSYATIPGKLLGLVSGALRQLVAALMISVPLIMALIWTFGIAQLVVGTLNTITVFLFVILFGMGIDFGIHIYSRYLETRLGGADVLDALRTAIVKTGAGIFTAAITTSAAFYSLQVADFKGFSDFGFIAGTGILCSMLAMLFLLPAFITFGERIRIIDAVSVTLTKGSPNDKKPLRGYKPLLAGVLVGVVITSLFLSKLGFEYDFKNLRSNLPGLSRVKAKIHELKMDAEGDDLGSAAVILADSHDDLNELVDALNKIKDEDKDKPTIAKIESIFDKLPQHQEDKLSVIREIRAIVDEDAIDLVDGEDKKRLVKLQKALVVDEPFSLEDVPLSVKRKFMGKDGSIGEFVMVYPSVLLRDGKNSIEFARDLRSLSSMDGIKTQSGKTYYASSGSIVAADMLILMQEDAKLAIFISLLMIVIFIFLDFRSIKRTLLVLAPLFFGFFILFGIQLIFDIKYNLFNMVVLPVIMGYGVDDSVHMVHRYLEQGAGSIRHVIKTTGWVVIMTTITTSAGFTGLIFVRHAGLNTIGVLAVLGLMAVMVSSLFILPAILQWLEERKPGKAASF